MTARVRPATPADAAAIAALGGELGYPRTATAVLASLKAVLASPDDGVWVGESGGALVGWIHVHAYESLESGPRADLMGLVVAAGARRAGVGRSLVAQAETWALARGLPAVHVRSNVQRTESHAFYPALGYERVKTQAVYRKRLGP